VVVVVGDAGGLFTSSEVGWALVLVVVFLVVGGVTLVIVSGAEVVGGLAPTVVFGVVVET